VSIFPSVAGDNLGLRATHHPFQDAAMKLNQVLNLIGDLPAAQIREVWESATPIEGTDLRPGIWLGRNGGMSWLSKQFVRHLVRRDYFAKLILDGWGINVRVKQDGTHALLASSIVPVGVRVDLPFKLTPAGLDYGYHVTGVDLGPRTTLQLRDFLRKIDFATLSEVVSLGQLRRVGAWRGQSEQSGELVVGYIAPVGIEALMGTPFGMIWKREATRAEIASAEAHVKRMRLWDTSPGTV
jgi:hypothetical protein